MVQTQCIDVLLVEDSPSDAFLVKESLDDSSLFRIVHVQRLGEALALLSERQMSVVLLDLGLPDSQGVDTLRKVHGHVPDVPLIVLTARNDEELAIDSAQEGAHEYLVKSELQEGNLRRAIRYVIERNLSERALCDSERQLRSIINSTPQCIKVISADGLVLEMNSAGIRMVEADTATAIIGQSIFPFIAPECRDQYRVFHEAVCRGQGGTLEFEIIGLRGTRRYLETVATALSNPDGSMSQLAISQDVTERRKAEAALLLRDRAILAVTQGILITDPEQPENPIIYASPGFERLTGYSADEVVGRNCRFLQGAATDPAAAARIREAIWAEQPCTAELLNYRKDGTPFWNELSVSPVVDGKGRMTHFVGVQVDVTERHRLEDQVRQAQKMEALGQLASGVAHDFNNLLTIIKGYSDLLLECLFENDPSWEPLDEIRKAAERAAGPTRQLLTFSRQQVLAPRVIDVNAVIADTEKMLRRVIGEDIQVTTALTPNLWAVRADPGQVGQVLLNLAVNARDAMPTGGQFTIETSNVEWDADYGESNPDVHTGSYVLLAISDTGCGMPPEVKERLFEPFFTTKEPGAGTGLGLATVYGIVKQAGGHIRVSSEVGQGTTLNVFLPRTRDECEEATSPSERGVASEGGGTILLVEDEAAVRALSRQVLASCGYTVIEAANGDEALRAGAQYPGPIHLVVTDLVMPGLNGRQVAERIQELHPQVRLLFVSGYTDDTVVKHRVLKEMEHFLQKPFSPNDLAHKVREVLDSPV